MKKANDTVDNSLVAHFSLDVCVNSENYRYSDPRVDKSTSFSMPVKMFSPEKFTELIQAIFEELSEKWTAAQAEYEAKKAAEEKGE
jgi:hypothetical protein